MIIEHGNRSSNVRQTAFESRVGFNIYHISLALDGLFHTYHSNFVPLQLVENALPSPAAHNIIYLYLYMTPITASSSMAGTRGVSHGA